MKMTPLDVLLLRKQALEDAFLTEDVAFLATQGIDEGLQAEGASVEGFDRVFAEPLSLGPVP